MGEIAKLNGFYEDFVYFNQTGQVFKDLVGDQDREILEPISSINDINQGAIFNALFSHVSHKALASKSVVLTEAETIYLDKWGEILKIDRPAGFSDAAYIGFILGRILSSIASLPQISRLFSDIPGVFVFPAKEMGFFSDFSCTDMGIVNPSVPLSRLASSVICFQSNCVYVYVPDLSAITPNVIAQMAFLQAGGTAIFIGEY